MLGDLDANGIEGPEREGRRERTISAFMGECNVTIGLAKQCNFRRTESKGIQDESTEGEADCFFWRRTV